MSISSTILAYFVMFGPIGAVVFAIPLGLATWLSATARDRSGWVAYGVLAILFLAPTIATFLYPGIIDATPRLRNVIFIVLAPLGLFWLFGTGIGFLLRLMRIGWTRLRSALARA